MAAFNRCTLFLWLFIMACASKKVNKEVEQVKSHQQESASVQSYRLIISFYSKGQGINKKLKEDLDTLIALRGNVYEKIRWGREGEFDYCFKLEELKVSDQDLFVKDVKAYVSDKEGVRLYENSVCVHKR